MAPKYLLLLALILVQACGPGQANLTVSHQVSPCQIWPATSGREPSIGTVTLTVAGEGQNSTVPIDVVLAIDSSASMTETDPTKMRLDAARSFVVRMDPARDRVGIVSFDDDVDFSLPPTGEFARVLEAIGGVDSDGRTNLDRGLAEAIDLLAANSTGSDERARFLVLLSDGDGDYTPSGRSGSQADRAKGEGVVIYTIGLALGDPAKRSLMDMAEATGGRHFDACNASALEAIYVAIGEEVKNLAGREVTVSYTLPGELSATGFTVPPAADSSSDAPGSEGRDLVWEVGDLSAGEAWSTSFAVSSEAPGVFELGKAGSIVEYQRRSGFVEILKIEGALLDVAELRSGASTALEVPFNFSAAKEIVGAVHEVEEENETSILWRFSGCNSGCGRDWAFLSDDGRIVVGSLRPFTLATKDSLVEDLIQVMEIIAAAGANVSEYNRSTAENAAEFYAPERGVYHQISYSFGADFDLVLVVPNSTLREARLSVTGQELDRFGGVADQEYYVDGNYVTGCEHHAFPWNGYCTAEAADITGIVPPGDHLISGRKISDPHTIILEAITAEEPEKEFFLYSRDYRSVWIPAKTNALRTPEEMLWASSERMG